MVRGEADRGRVSRVALLRGPPCGVGTVAPDPAPGIDTATVLDPIGMDRVRFAEELTEEGITAKTRAP